MEQIDFNTLIGSITKLKVLVFPYVEEMKNFQFTFRNPLFWALFFLSILLLSGFWRFKKAISFSAIIAVILLAATYIENSSASFFSQSAFFDSTLLRLFSVFLIMLVSLYFFFIRTD